MTTGCLFTLKYLADLGVGPVAHTLVLETNTVDRCTLRVTTIKQLRKEHFDPLLPYFPEGAELYVVNTLAHSGAEILFTVKRR